VTQRDEAIIENVVRQDAADGDAHSVPGITVQRGVDLASLLLRAPCEAATVAALR
jgi:hypothetical protein